MIRTLQAVDLANPTAVAAADRTDVRLRSVTDGPTPSAGTAPLTWLVLTPVQNGWPDDEALRRMLAGGVIGLALELPPLGSLDNQQTTQLIAFLARATSHGMLVSWDSDGLRAPASWLVHLVPPRDDRRWQTAHWPCMFFWRQGAGFLAVHDVRHEPGARYVIDDKDLLALFTLLAEPLDTRHITAAEHQLLDQLVETDLAFQIGHHAVALPYRLRNWPTPVLHA